VRAAAVVSRARFAYRGCIRKDVSRMIDDVLDAHDAPLGVLGRIGDVCVFELRPGMELRLRSR
jgi:hypothetical protein